MRSSQTTLRDGDVTEASGSVVIGIISIALLTVLLGGILLLDAVSIRKALALLQRNLNLYSVHVAAANTSADAADVLEDVTINTR